MITYGGSLPKALTAADLLAADGIAAEIVDLRSLRPLDTATILGSVAKTHRALVVDEGWRTGSLAAEVSARIMEGGFYDLDGPVQRLCSAEVPMPYARHMEDAALPQPATIAAAARAMLRLSDATITVTSLGEQGVDSVVGIVYPPQVAIVGFGRIVARPWIVLPRPVVTATLSADHRVSDGHRGGRFLAAVEPVLQSPERL